MSSSAGRHHGGMQQNYYQGYFTRDCFSTTVESVLLYSCGAWTITPKLAKELDGCYTRF